MIVVIKGIGLDLTELNRIERLIKRQPKFIDRILTEKKKKINTSHLHRGEKLNMLPEGLLRKRHFQKLWEQGLVNN